ncbi:MAG: hypothetical protein AB7O52_16160 [Planctomycetota bacterium]
MTRTYLLADPEFGEIAVTVSVDTAVTHAHDKLRWALRRSEASERIEVSGGCEVEAYLLRASQAPHALALRNRNITVQAAWRQHRDGPTDWLSVAATEFAAAIEGHAIPTSQASSRSPTVNATPPAHIIRGERTLVRVSATDPYGEFVEFFAHAPKTGVSCWGEAEGIVVTCRGELGPAQLSAWAVNDSLLPVKFMLELQVEAPVEVDARDGPRPTTIETSEVVVPPAGFLFEPTTMHNDRAAQEAAFEHTASDIGLLPEMLRTGYVSGFDPSYLGGGLRVLEDQANWPHLQDPYERTLVLSGVDPEARYRLEVKVAQDQAIARQYFLFLFRFDPSRRWSRVDGIGCPCYQSDPQYLGYQLRLIQDNVFVAATITGGQGVDMSRFAKDLCRAIESTSVLMSSAKDDWPTCWFEATETHDEEGRELLAVRAEARYGRVTHVLVGGGSLSEYSGMEIVVPTGPRIECGVVDMATRVSVCFWSP